MRILMLSDVYFPRVNGVSTSIMTFIHGLRAQGHEVRLIAPRYAAEAADETDIERIPSRRVLLDPEDRMMRAGEIRRRQDAIAAWQPDLVHIHTPFVAHYLGLRLARRLNLPVIETYHTYFEEYLFHYIPFLPRATLRRLARGFSRRQCNAVDALVVPSRAMQRVLQEYGVRTPMSVIPTGLELDGFHRGDRAGFCAEHGIDPNRPILMHIGRVAHEKNIHFLLEMVEELSAAVPDVLLVIAGEGPARAQLQRQVRELDIEDNVRFIGYLERGAPLWNCYSAADVFVFASRTETQGLVLLEAMALGVPVVSTACMGTHDILDAGRGAIVAREEVEDFADKVAQLLRNAGFRALLGNEGRHYAATWSSERMTEKLIQLYEQRLRRPARLHVTAMAEMATQAQGITRKDS